MAVDATVNVTWLKAAGLQAGRTAVITTSTAETLAAQGLGVLTSPPADAAAVDKIFFHKGRKDV